jgi:hypothetical protein
MAGWACGRLPEAGHAAEIGCIKVGDGAVVERTALGMACFLRVPARLEGERVRS